MQTWSSAMTADEAAAKLDEMRYTLAHSLEELRGVLPETPPIPQEVYDVIDKARERVYRPDVEPADVLALCALKVISVLADDALADVDVEVRF